MDRTILEYNAKDVIYTLDVHQQLLPHLDDRYWGTYKFTERLLEPLMFMMSRGVLIDFDRLNEVKEQLNKKLIVKEEKLNEIAGRELNANSPKQLKEYFYIEKGIKPYTKRNAKGESSITLDDKALQRIARGTSNRPGLPEAKLVQEIRGLRKLLGTYIDIDFDEDKRFRCSYNPRGTRFGRLSSSKTIFGTGMNMQNLPEIFKQFLVADPGYLMWEIDKAKAEWVVVAYLTGDSNMLKVIEEHLDPHIHTGYLMTDLPKELIEEEAELIKHATDPDVIGEIRNKLSKASIAVRNAYENASFIPRNMSVRQAGKKANHGLNYDEGFRTFALMNEMLESDAKKIVNLYKHKAYPGIPIWHRSIQEKLRHDRTLTNCFGRTYKFLGAWNEDLFKAAYAYLPQSTVADLVNKGIIDTYYDTSDIMLDIDLLGQVHDSVLSESLITDSKYAWVDIARGIKRVGKYMDSELEYSGRTFHIDNDLKVGTTWGNMKDVDLSASDEELSKQIVGVYDELSQGA